ncbi:MAG: RNA polymerase sigma factor [Candidatus Binatia bacterium]
MTPEERTLIAGCVKGEKASWDAFVQQYSNLVYQTIRKTMSLYHAEPRDEAVDDLFQEFFQSLLRDNCKKLRQFKGDKNCSLASWIRVIAARQTIDFLRKQSPPVAQVSDAYPALHGEVPSDSPSQVRERRWQA